MKDKHDHTTDDLVCCSTSEENEKTEEACAPGCNCHASKPKSRFTNILQYGIGGLVILLASVLIFYQTSKLKQTTPSDAPVNNYAAETKQSGMNNQSVETSAQPGIPSQSATKPNWQNEGKKFVMGEFLPSFNDLNNVAMDKDTVFVYITDDHTTPIQAEIEKAMQEALKTLNANGIKVGIFTLSTSAPEYSEITRISGKLPFIVVSTKGKGTSFVEGPITGNKILQAYTSTTKTRAEGGCCPTSPGGCG